MTDEDQIKDDIEFDNSTNSNDTESEQYVSNILGIDDSDNLAKDNVQEDNIS